MRRCLRLFANFVGAVFVLLPACSSVEFDEESIGTTSQAMVGPCSDLVVSPPDPSDQVCRGPWFYRRHQPKCRVVKADPRCGYAHPEKLFPEYALCEHGEFGVASLQKETFTQDIHGAAKSKKVMEFDQGRRIGLTTVFSHYDFATSCSGLAFQRREAIIQARRAHDPRNSLDRIVAVGSIDNSIGPEADAVRRCTVTLTNIPIWNARAAAPCPQIGEKLAPDVTQPQVPRTCEVDSDSPYECPLTEGIHFSPAGRKIADALTGDPLAEHQAGCLTGDTFPATTDEDVNKKFAHMNRMRAAIEQNVASMAALPDRAAVRSYLVGNSKLLMEMRGSQLHEPHFNTELTLYATEPEVNHECVSSAPTIGPFPAASADENSRLAHATLSFCARLAADHIRAAEPAFHAKRCLEAANIVAKLSSPTREIFRERFVDMSEVFLRKLDGEPIVSTDAPERGAAIRARLVRIADWYRGARTLYSAAERNQLYAATHRITSGFWRAIYARQLTDVRASERDALSKLAFDAEQMELAVLTELLRPGSDEAPAALDTAPLLAIAGDALHGLSSRLNDMSPIHDMACRFSPCAQTPSQSTFTALWRAIALLGDSQKLSAYLERPALRIPNEWQRVFKAFSMPNSPYFSALSDTFAVHRASPALLMTTSSVDMPSVAAELSRIVQLAQRRMSNYIDTGLFSPTGANVLVTGVQDSKVASSVAEVRRASLELTSVIAEYERGRAREMQVLLDQFATRQSHGDIDVAIEKSTADFMDKSRSLAALRVSVAADDAAFGNVADAFGKAVARDRESAELRIASIPETLPTVTRDDARYFANSSTLLDDISIAPRGTVWKRSIGAGEVLTFDVSGTWSPTCALSRSPAARDIVDIAHASIGPEGFFLQNHQSKYSIASQANTTTSETRTSKSASLRACNGHRIEAGAPGLLKAVYGVAGYGYAFIEGCLAVDSSKANSSSHSNSDVDASESRATSMFSTGMRLASTPFPDLPAGSLLLVGVLPTRVDSASIRVVKVLQSSHNVVVVSEPLDFYLVVNDESGCGKGLGGLTVSMTRLTPAGAKSKALAEAMATTLNELRERRNQIIERGSLLLSEPDAIRALAAVSLRKHLGADPQRTAPGYLGFFHALLETEITRLQKIAAIRNTQFELTQLATVLKGYAFDGESTARQGRLLDLMPQWALRELDATRLRSSMRSIVDTISYEIHPALALRHPESLAAAKEDRALQSELATIMNDGASTSLAELSVRVRDAAEKIATLSERALRRAPDPGQNTFRAVISFPRPDVEARARMSEFHRIVDSRSEVVWNAARSGDVARISVRPSDLYSRSGGFSRVPCNMGAPVLNGMAIYVGGVDAAPAKALNAMEWKTTVKTDSLVDFATSEGLVSYRIGNEQFREGTIGTLFGASSDAALAYRPRQEGVRPLVGMSPFTSFSIDFSGLNTISSRPLDEATELLLVFELDTKVVPDGVRGVSSCGDL